MVKNHSISHYADIFILPLTLKKVTASMKNAVSELCTRDSLAEAIVQLIARTSRSSRYPPIPLLLPLDCSIQLQLFNRDIN